MDNGCGTDKRIPVWLLSAVTGDTGHCEKSLSVGTYGSEFSSAFGVAGAPLPIDSGLSSGYANGGGLGARIPLAGTQWLSCTLLSPNRHADVFVTDLTVKWMPAKAVQGTVRTPKHKRPKGHGRANAMFPTRVAAQILMRSMVLVGK